MPKSIRVSDTLFAEAEREARLMHRSIAAQVEHWVKLGRALEGAGLSVAAIRSALQAGGGDRPDPWLSIAKRAYQEQSRESARDLGPEAMHLVPKSVLRRARVRFPDVDFDD